MQKLTRKIYRALAETGESALIGKGWGNLGVIEVGALPAVFMLHSLVLMQEGQPSGGLCTACTPHWSHQMTPMQTTRRRR